MIEGWKFIDLFSGIGGFRLGLEELGAECVWSCEIDDKAAEAYKANFGDNPATDITIVPVDAIPSHDILCAGFPCQSFSVAGNRKGFDDSRGQLFFEIIRVAEYHQPKVLLLENVARLLTADKGEVFRVITEELDRIGYDLHYAILNASRYGIPQARKRFYGVAIRKGEPLTWAPPEPTDEPCCVADIMLPEAEVQDLYVKNKVVITHPQNLGRVTNEILCVGYIEKLDGTTRPTTSNGSVKVSQGARVFSADNHAATQMGGKIVGGGGARGGLYASQGYRAYASSGHAIAQTKDGGGVGAKTGLYADEVKARTLHTLEMKRVMGFPDSHVVSEGRHGRSQCGNAVIPKMIYLVAKGLSNG